MERLLLAAAIVPQQPVFLSSSWVPRDCVRYLGFSLLDLEFFLAKQFRSLLPVHRFKLFYNINETLLAVNLKLAVIELNCALVIPFCLFQQA